MTEIPESEQDKRMRFVAVRPSVGFYVLHYFLLGGHRRRAERVCEFLLAVVHWLLVGRDSEQNALDLLQD